MRPEFGQQIGRTCPKSAMGMRIKVSGIRAVNERHDSAAHHSNGHNRARQFPPPTPPAAQEQGSPRRCPCCTAERPSRLQGQKSQRERTDDCCLPRDITIIGCRRPARCARARSDVLWLLHAPEREGRVKWLAQANATTTAPVIQTVNLHIST